MDEYQHLRDSADEAAVLADLDALGIGFGPAPEPEIRHLQVPEGPRWVVDAARLYGIPLMAPDRRWDDAMLHSDARRGYAAGIGVR